MMKTSLAMALLLTALVSGCGDDGGGTGGGGVGGGGGGGYVGRATVIVMNAGPERLVLEVRDESGQVRTADLGPAQVEELPAGLVEGSTFEGGPCLVPDVRKPGETERLSLLSCSVDGDVVAIGGGVSAARSQLPEAPAQGVQFAHLTRLGLSGQFFAVDPTSGEGTQLWALGEQGVDVPYDAALGFLPSSSAGFVIYAESGWLGGPTGFAEGSQLVSMATDDGAGDPALHFVVCELAAGGNCLEVVAPD